MMDAILVLDLVVAIPMGIAIVGSTNTTCL